MQVQQHGLPLATSTWDHRELQALQDVIASGQFTMGAHVRAFEQAFAETFGARHAVMVNSGSSANLLMVAAAVLDDRIDLNPGDEVLVTAVSWATTYYPLTQYGLRPVLVDVDPHTLNIDIEAARARCTDRTKGIMAVNLLGNPNRFDELQRLAAEEGLVVLEDNCESMGATFADRSAGTFGLMGTFSTFFSHHISTMEGGVVVTDDEHLAHMLLSLRSHGWTRNLPEGSPLRPAGSKGFHDLFQFVLPGYNVRPLEMSGAVGLHQLEKLPAMVATRRANADAFRELMSRVPGVRIQQEVGESSWFGFSCVLVDHLAGRRDDVVAALAEVGVQTRPVVAGNFARNPVVRHLNADTSGSLVHADEVHDNGFYLGNHHYFVGEALERVAHVLDSFR
ncbi:DegT/DnrJ/EryC1/StrS family aminotransferase [Streptomyces sp. NP160]|nr:DegT/DnrJ/EryC1/StrS family aminotransferase [Streptomyces sp. NP160]